MKKGQVENGKEKAKKIKNKKQKENRKRKRKAEICSVKKADGRALAGQAGRKVID